MAAIGSIPVEIHLKLPQSGNHTAHRVTKHVESHDTTVLECPESGFRFTRVQTGCIRVQKGDFCAYITEDDAYALYHYIRDTAPGD